MAKNKKNLFALGYVAKNANGEKTTFVMKSPQFNNTLVKLDGNVKFRTFATYKAAFAWLCKFADEAVEGLKGFEVVRLPRVTKFEEKVDDFYNGWNFKSPYRKREKAVAENA